jgi:hypothetical protein
MNNVQKPPNDPEMREEYDFTDGLVAKYAARYAKGTTVAILDSENGGRTDPTARAHPYLRAAFRRWTTEHPDRADWLRKRVSEFLTSNDPQDDVGDFVLLTDRRLSALRPRPYAVSPTKRSRGSAKRRNRRS